MDLIEKALEFENLPIYEELIFRISNYAKSVEKGLKTGDEVTITNFLRDEVS